MSLIETTSVYSFFLKTKFISYDNIGEIVCEMKADAESISIKMMTMRV